jgi:hypothetical protein
MTFVVACAIGATAGWMLEKNCGDAIRRWGAEKLERLLGIQL